MADLSRYFYLFSPAHPISGSYSLMTTDVRENQIIEDLIVSYRRLPYQAVLNKIQAIPPLANDDAPCWYGEQYWDEVVYPYIALANIAAERKLEAAVPLILDRAYLGDPFGITGNICDVLEAIVKPDYLKLETHCLLALKSPRAGTRLWAARTLLSLGDYSPH